MKFIKATEVHLLWDVSSMCLLIGLKCLGLQGYCLGLGLETWCLGIGLALTVLVLSLCVALRCVAVLSDAAWCHVDAQHLTTPQQNTTHHRISCEYSQVINVLH